MTMYRSDHEAAVARIDALEAENAKLAEENKQLRARPQVVAPKPAKVPSLATLVAVSAFGAFTVVLSLFVMAG